MAWWDALLQAVFGHRSEVSMYLYCASGQVTAGESAFIVIAWFAFVGAALYVATVDISQYWMGVRSDPSR